MNQNIAPSVTVVLGAGGAIGAACCRAFAEAGRRLLACDLDLQSAETAIAGLPLQPVALEADVTAPAAMSAVARDAGALGTVSDLVYAPGVTITSAIEETSWADYRRLMAVNLDGAFYAAAAFVSIFKRQGKGGSILLLSSTAGRRGEAGASHYCASKFGLIGLAESLAAELTADCVRVNVVCPGNVHSPMLSEVVRDIARMRGAEEHDVWEAMRSAGSARRLITPEEVAAACVAICGPAFSAMTGATLTIDAGAMVG